MKWGKLVLIFQAVVTLILGAVFFSQVLNVDYHKISSPEIIENPSSETTATLNINEIQTRYSSASYILLFVSLIELLIITRLLT